MSLILITGVSGSGKSEVLKELKLRGYDAHGTDEDDIAGFCYRDTRERARDLPTREEQTHNEEWYQRYGWFIDRAGVEELAKNTADHLAFLCGTAENQDEVLDLFTGVIALDIDEDTIKHRIASRTDNNFGKEPYEMQSIMEWQRRETQKYKEMGFVVLDSTRAVGDVVDSVLKNAKIINASHIGR